MSKITTWKYTKPSFWDDFFDGHTYGTAYQNGFMRADISKRKGNYVFDVDIPGYAKEDIMVKLEQGYLTIMVDAKKQSTVSENQEENYEYLHQERYNGQYSRSFYVGCPDDTKANATYHNGVLTVVIPEVTETEVDKTKYIAIN